MGSFVYVDADFLRSIAAGNPQTPSLYYHPNLILRHFFWDRLKLIQKLFLSKKVVRNRCLDFGGGSGVFLPTLAKYFKNVTAIDLDMRDARKVIDKYGLNNVELIQENVSEADINPESFDVIIAADVLEHFQNLELPVLSIKKWITRGGHLITSLPTENFIYVGLRKIFNITKPVDHYHTAADVEAFLVKHKFVAIKRKFGPLRVPLFSITLWCYQGNT